MTSQSLTEEELTTLSNRAVAAKSTAYTPYSHFRVGACILTAQGEYIPGANVENVSFPVGTCAERVAMGSAVVRFPYFLSFLLLGWVSCGWF